MVGRYCYYYVSIRFGESDEVGEFYIVKKSVLTRLLLGGGFHYVSHFCTFLVSVEAVEATCLCTSAFVGKHATAAAGEARAIIIF